MVYRNVLTRRKVCVFCLTLALCLICGNQFLKINTLEHIHDAIELDVEYTTEEAAPTFIYHKGYPLFQSNDPIDFPVVTNGTPRIPQIIHQIADSELVLHLFSDCIRSFVDKNPAWEYRFWTYKSGRNLLELHHPYLLDVYDKFGENSVKKSDLLRFAVIYEYGGIYADLDVKNMRSLDRVTTKYACIVPTEPFEHSAIVFNTDCVLSTAVLLCRPKHPFFLQLLLNLQLADPNGNPVVVTGPWYITEVYLSYNKISRDDLQRNKTDNRSNSPYFYKGAMAEEHDDAVYIPNSQYFMDNVDLEFIKDGELNICNEQTTMAKIQVLIYRACNEFNSRKLLRKRRKYAFTFHYWSHMWTLSQEKIDTLEKRHIKDIVPNCIIYQR